MPRHLHVVVVLVFATLVVTAPLLSQGGRKPLTKMDVIDLLQNGVPSSRVEELVRQYKTSFEVTGEVERELREAGATADLLQALREVAPAKPAPAPPPTNPVLLVEATPPRAEVYVDDEPQGRTSADGRLKLSQLAPGEHRVRISLSGYRDYERTINLPAGQSTRLVVNLETVAPGPSVQQPAPPVQPSPAPPATPTAPGAQPGEVDRFFEQFFGGAPPVSGNLGSYLGVSIGPLNDSLARQFGAPDTRGELVHQVAQGSPAEKAGFRPGDVIITYQGQAVDDIYNPLPPLVERTPPGTEVMLGVLRAGKPVTLRAKLGARSAEMARASWFGRAPDGSTLRGVKVREIQPAVRERLRLPTDSPGVLILEVAANTPAGQAGLRPGDVIEEINRQQLKTILDFGRLAAQAKGETLLRINRQGASTFTVLPPQ